MVHYSVIEKLRKQAQVSYEDAREALEMTEWDVLDAYVWLEAKGKIGSMPWEEDQAQQENNEEKKEEANAQQMPANEAMASEVSKTNEAQVEEDAQEIEMYEGALAGLSEEEIAKMALAEEAGTARTETTGTETAVD